MTRLNKFISETGICSRREADKLIEAGKVMVNGKIAELGMKVTVDDEISVNGKPLNSKSKIVYIALNKPAGITCTTDITQEDNIIDFIKYPGRIFPIGRLDKPSQGLIFLTNDGDIVNKILRAGNKHEKEYLVTVDEKITPGFISAMSNGVAILDTVTKKCFVEQTGPHSFRIILVQGLNRQIRRMCEALGFQVRKLKRTRIMNVTLEGIPEGKWRYLTAEEMAFINSAGKQRTTIIEHRTNILAHQKPMTDDQACIHIIFFPQPGFHGIERLNSGGKFRYAWNEKINDIKIYNFSD